MTERETDAQRLQFVDGDNSWFKNPVIWPLIVGFAMYEIPWGPFQRHFNCSWDGQRTWPTSLSSANTTFSELCTGGFLFHLPISAVGFLFAHRKHVLRPIPRISHWPKFTYIVHNSLHRSHMLAENEIKRTSTVFNIIHWVDTVSTRWFISFNYNDLSVNAYGRGQHGIQSQHNDETHQKPPHSGWIRKGGQHLCVLYFGDDLFALSWCLSMTMDNFIK